LRLFTNIENVELFVNGAYLRLHCTALVISKNALGGGNTPQRVTGFMGSMMNPEVFDLHPRCGYLDYSLGDLHAGGSSITTPDGSVTIYGSWHTLTFADGTAIKIVLSNSALPLDVADFDKDDELGIEPVLEQKSLAYWHQSDFPVTNWVSIEEAAEALSKIPSIPC
jgi:hypothetical protein